MSQVTSNIRLYFQQCDVYINANKPVGIVKDGVIYNHYLRPILRYVPSFYFPGFQAPTYDVSTPVDQIPMVLDLDVSFIGNACVRSSLPCLRHVHTGFASGLPKSVNIGFQMYTIS